MFYGKADDLEFPLPLLIPSPFKSNQRHNDMGPPALARMCPRGFLWLSLLFLGIEFGGGDGEGGH